MHQFIILVHFSSLLYCRIVSIFVLFFNFFYNVLISTVQQSDSVINIYILFHILFDYGLTQDIKYSSLCYTVGLY